MKKIWPFVTGLNIIVALVIINIVAFLLPSLQLDLTGNKLHSLTGVSKKVVKNLDDIINVKVFVTADLPPEIKPIASDLTTILKEFERINPSKLKVTFQDPSKDEKAKSEATKYGIQTLQFSSVKSDKFEVQNGYFGLVMLYGNKQEILPVVGDVGNLEYFFVSGIKKLTSKEIPSVSVVEDTPVNSGSNYQYFRKYLAKSYNVDEVTLDGDSKLPENNPVLVILGRSKKIDDKGIKKLEDWSKSGKGMIAFLDRVGVGQNMQPVKFELTGLEKLYAEKGMKIEDKLIMDDSATVANFNTQSGAFIIKYPYWPEIRSENINSKIPFLSGINSLTLAWASPIDVSDNAKILFTTSDATKLDENISNLSPLAKNSGSGENKKYTEGAINTDGVKMALVGDSDMLKDQFVVNNQQNLIFALNLVDYFAQDSSLFAIRSKILKNSPLKTVSESMKSTIKAVNLTAPMIILMVIYTLSSFVRKKRIKRWYELEKE
jgi:ABC-type uncharacterized transport system involved in gliding motility auxiliary subunit